MHTISETQKISKELKTVLDEFWEYKDLANKYVGTTDTQDLMDYLKETLKEVKQATDGIKHVEKVLTKKLEVMQNTLNDIDLELEDHLYII